MDTRNKGKTKHIIRWMIKNNIHSLTIRVSIPLTYKYRPRLMERKRVQIPATSLFLLRGSLREVGVNSSIVSAKNFPSTTSNTLTGEYVKLKNDNIQQWSISSPPGESRGHVLVFCSTDSLPRQQHQLQLLLRASIFLDNSSLPYLPRQGWNIYIYIYIYIYCDVGFVDGFQKASTRLIIHICITFSPFGRFALSDC